MSNAREAFYRVHWKKSVLESTLARNDIYLFSSPSMGEVGEGDTPGKSLLVSFSSKGGSILLAKSVSTSPARRCCNPFPDKKRERPC